MASARKSGIDVNVAVIGCAHISVIAQVSAARLSISVALAAPVSVSAEEVNGGLEADLRSGRVALAIEEIEAIGNIGGKLQTVGLDGSVQGGVNSTQIHNKVIIDVRVYIIISQKIEVLSSLVGEMGVHNHTETIVMLVSIFAVIPRAPIVPAQSVQREKIEVGETSKVWVYGVLG